MTALTQDPHTDHFVARYLTNVSNQELQLYVKEKKITITPIYCSQVDVPSKETPIKALHATKTW